MVSQRIVVAARPGKGVLFSARARDLPGLPRGNRIEDHRERRAMAGIEVTRCLLRICFSGVDGCWVWSPGFSRQELAYGRVARSFFTRPEPRTLCRLKAGLQTFHGSLARAKHVPESRRQPSLFCRQDAGSTLRLQYDLSREGAFLADRTLFLQSVRVDCLR